MIEFAELNNWAERIAGLSAESQIIAIGHLAIKVFSLWPDPEGACQMSFEFARDKLPPGDTSGTVRVAGPFQE